MKIWQSTKWICHLQIIHLALDILDPSSKCTHSTESFPKKHFKWIGGENAENIPLILVEKNGIKKEPMEQVESMI